MIVPMKKAAVITQSKDAPGAIEALRSLGVLHVEHQNPPKGKDISDLQDDMSAMSLAASILGAVQAARKKALKQEPYPLDHKALAAHIIDSQKRLEQLDDYSRNLKQRIEQWERWGDFDPKTIASLAEKDIHVKLCQIPVKEMARLPEGVMVKSFFTSEGVANCAVISRGHFAAAIPFKELALPKTGLNETRKRLEEDLRVMESIRNDIRSQAQYRRSLISAVKDLGAELEFHETLKGMGISGRVAYVTGYVPHDGVSLIMNEARRQSWAIWISDPSADDMVPTLVRNPRWISFISPVFKILEIVPGYSELDISLWFLVFFSIFFGMLIGDAGYGIIYLALTFFAQRKFGLRTRDKSVFTLFYILSTCAVIWGLLTGTIFGQEWLSGLFRPLMPALAENKNVQTLCFFLGALHLSIAHLWRAVLKAPSPAALADVGWTSILWGSFFLAKVLVLGDGFPAFAKWFFITGPILVLFFTNPSKNILKGVLDGFSVLALSFVNTFTDVVSYLRLFAVGLAGVAVADAFNKMAMSVGFSSILAGAATSLILVLGHMLNVVLGPMAVLVHGVRLNVLEFCGHVDVKWSGFSYKPLKGLSPDS